MFFVSDEFLIINSFFSLIIKCAANLLNNDKLRRFIYYYYRHNMRKSPENYFIWINRIEKLAKAICLVVEYGKQSRSFFARDRAVQAVRAFGNFVRFVFDLRHQKKRVPFDCKNLH